MTKMTGYFIGAALLCAGCSRSETTSAPEVNASDPPKPNAAEPSGKSAVSSGDGESAPKGGGSAHVGKMAPDFELLDLEGQLIRLKDHRGKLVVLEWFNPECPFVRAAHTKGSLIDTARKLKDKGVVYLAINSGGPGKQGHGKQANLAGKERFGLQHPILLDEKGTVGRLYGATNTPHIFVIDREGRLAYAGAVDNSKDGEGKSPEGGQLVNYLVQAVGQLEAGQPVAVPKTEAYGCSVKYGD